MLELIVVVAIILILSGLLFPAILHLIEKAKKSRVRTQLHSIVAAAKSYKNEYGRWPGQKVQGVDFTTHHGDFIHDLTNNPRNLLFIEIDPTWVTGASINDTFVDAWGNDIYIALDRDGDGDNHRDSCACSQPPYRHDDCHRHRHDDCHCHRHRRDDCHCHNNILNK